MQQGKMREYLKNNYHYGEKGDMMEWNGEKIHAYVCSLSMGGGSYYLQPQGINENIWNENARVFFFAGESQKQEKSTTFLRDNLERKTGNGTDEYIISIECKKLTGKVVTSTLNKDFFESLVEEINKDYERGIYRKETSGTNSVFIVLIRVVENGEEVTKYFNAYLAASDSRTYCNVKYTIAQFQPSTSINNPKSNVDWPKNLLVFGAPGTGKSYAIDKKIEELDLQNRMKRVTFYEDYTYEKFVGSYIPKIKPNKETKYEGKVNNTDMKVCATTESISYEFVPGVFLKMIADAYYATTLGNPEPYVLVIEEINRANAAAAFGEMFQLLDRKSDGESEYEITLESAAKEWFVDYLLSKADYDEETKGNAKEHYEAYAEHFKLPSNLYIWATMNSADQGVFPLDSAFKRRWSFIYKSVDESRTDNNRYIYTYWKKKSDTTRIPVFIDWDTFRKAINTVMSSPQASIEEDRFIGPWYFKPQEYSQIFGYTQSEPQSRNSLPNPLCDKLLNYIRNDVFRNNPSDIFKDNYTSLYKVRQGMQDGVGINEILKVDIEEQALINPENIMVCFNEGCTLSREWQDIKNSYNIEENIVLDINNVLTERNQNDSEEVRKELLKSTLEQISNLLKSDERKDEFEKWLNQNQEEVAEKVLANQSTETKENADNGEK